MPLVAGFLLAASLTSSALQADSPATRRLRLQWTAEQPVFVRGFVEADHATFALPQNLSLAAASTADFQLGEAGHRLAIEPTTASDRGGFDLQINGDPQAQLTVAFATADSREALASTPPAPRQSIRLNELAEGSPPIEIAEGVQLWLRPTPGEGLQADFGRDSLVFWTEESCPLQLALPSNRLPANGPLEVRLRIRAARGGRVIRQSDWPLPAAATFGPRSIKAGPLQMPSEEGAYDFEFECVRVAERPLPLLPQETETLLRRTVQVVVVRPANPESETAAPSAGAPSAGVPAAALSPGPAASSSLVGQIEPFGSSWSMPRLVPSVPDALAGVSKLLASSKQSIASGPLGEAQHEGETVAVLAAGGWYAYPLPITSWDRPHIVTVRYPIGQAMRMGISVVQQDAAGRVAPLGTDSGLATDVPIETNAAPAWGEHRIVFWPHCEDPFLVLANHDTSEPARFASIRVEAVNGPLAATVGAAPAPAGPAPSAEALDTRLAALYLDKPLLAECFGDQGALDPASGLVLEDWVTFLKASQRLADYLQWAGFNGAILTVASEGGTLYPTERFAATPRFDTGSFSSAGHDPLRKDVLELLFRIFDRAGLRLVPAVELATPLPALERVRRDTEAFVGIEPVDAAGRSLLSETPPRHGLAAYYNPLDRRVQAELVAAVAEIAQRYGRHPAYYGVGLQLGPQTYAQLPSPAWCRDRRTVQNFAAATADAPRSLEALQRWIDQPGQEAFVDWRAEEMTGLYADLAEATQGKRLLLLTADSTLPVDTHRTKGLDWSRLSEQENIVPMRLLRESVFRDAVQQSRDALANENLDWDRILAPSPVVGGLVFRPPSDLKIAGFADKAPATAGGQRQRWFTQAVPAGTRYRRQLTGMMDQMDPQVLAVGGWTTPLGQEHHLRETLQMFARLPATGMRPVLPADQRPSNLRVRQAQLDDRTVIALVNLGPWSSDIEVVFDQDVTVRAVDPGAPARSQPGSPSKANPAGEQRSRRLWRTSLASGALTAIAIDQGAAIKQWQTEPTAGSGLVRRLNERTRELASRVAILSNPRRYDALTNGGFERPRELNAIPGWLHSQHPSDGVRLESSGWESGQALRLKHRADSGAKPWIVSDPIQPPPTGRLAVSLRVRAFSEQGTTARPARLRVAIEGWTKGTPLRRDKILTPPMDGTWQEEPLWLEVEDVGADEVEQLRLTIDLLSPGEVWLDEIRLYDFFLTEPERSELQSRAFLAIERLRQGHLTPAAKLFDSHWGRYLMALRVQAPVAEATMAPQAGSAPESGIADRLRNWLPTPMF